MIFMKSCKPTAGACQTVASSFGRGHFPGDMIFMNTRLLHRMRGREGEKKNYSAQGHLSHFAHLQPRTKAKKKEDTHYSCVVHDQMQGRCLYVEWCFWLICLFIHCSLVLGRIIYMDRVETLKILCLTSLNVVIMMRSVACNITRV